MSSSRRRTSRHVSPRRLAPGILAASLAASPLVVSGGLPAAADTPPASLVGLVAGSVLVHFDEADPTVIVDTVPISGLQAGEWVMSIDTRPGSGQLLALAVTNTAGDDRGRLYSVDPLTGRATATGTVTVDTIEDGARTTIDINPTVDRLRVVGSLDQNLRLNPNNGALAAPDTDLTSGSQVVSIAYDQNVPAAAPGATTTLFGISAGGTLVRVGGVNGTPSPNAGAVTAIGSLGATPDDTGIGFDITAEGTAFATMSVAGSTGLYRIDLTTGVATLVSTLGNGLLDVTDLAVLVDDEVPAGASQYTGLASATRLLDTRSSTKVDAGGTVTVGIRGQAGIPAAATAVVLNVTVTDPTAPGFTTVWPSGVTRPNTSSVNTDAGGQTRAALVTVPIGADGSVRLFSERGSHVLVDAVGYYRPAVSGAGHLAPLTPARLLDTRIGLGVTGGSAARTTSGGALEVQVTGRGGVPAANVGSVVVNVTATDGTAPGFVTAYAGGAVRPTASNLNTSAVGETIANLAIVPVSATGTISLFTETSTHLIVDVVGYFGSDAAALATPKGLFVPVSPARVLDTRSGFGASAGPVAAGASVDVQVSGRGGFPSAGVLAMAGTVTVTDSAAAGYVTAFPAGVTRPTASVLNTNRAGQTVANALMLGLGTGGKVTLFTETGGQLIADVVGYYLD